MRKRGGLYHPGKSGRPRKTDTEETAAIVEGDALDVKPPTDDGTELVAGS